MIINGGAEPPCSHYAAPATLHKIHLVLNRLREATHAARSIIMQGWNGPLGCYLHLSVFPATSNLLMMIKEQRGSAARWKRAPSSREWPRIHNHPELKPLFDKNQEKLAGRLPRTTCKPPATPHQVGVDATNPASRCDIKIVFLMLIQMPGATEKKEIIILNIFAKIKWLWREAGWNPRAKYNFCVYNKCKTLNGD